MEVPMTLIMCASCGMPFMIPVDVEQRLQRCHKLFYCPSGHGQYFSSKSDIEILQDKLKEKDIQIEFLQKNQKKRKK